MCHSSWALHAREESDYISSEQCAGDAGSRTWSCAVVRAFWRHIAAAATAAHHIGTRQSSGLYNTGVRVCNCMCVYLVTRWVHARVATIESDALALAERTGQHRIHIHAHTHTHTHTHTHKHTHTHTNTNRRTNTHTHKHAHTHINTHTCTHIAIETRVVKASARQIISAAATARRIESASPPPRECGHQRGARGRRDTRPYY